MASLDDTQTKECEVLLEEYKRLSNEISKRLDYCDRNISYQFLLLGIIGTGITTILNMNEGSLEKALIPIQYILLIFPILFNLLGFYYSLNNIYIFKIAKYITNYIRPRMAVLLQTEINNILGYGSYIENEIFGGKKKVTKLMTIIGMYWTISIPALLLISYFFLKFKEYRENGILDKQLSLLILNILVMLVSIIVNSRQYPKIYRQRNQTNIS
jgi:hypothetical protein